MQPGRSGLERDLWLLAPLNSPAGFVCSMHFLGQKRWSGNCVAGGPRAVSGRYGRFQPSLRNGAF